MDFSYIASSSAKWMAAPENLGIFIKLSLHLQYDSAVFILSYYPREIKTLDPTKAYARIFIETIHNCPKPEVIQMSLKGWPDTQSVLWPLDRIFLRKNRKRKKWLIDHLLCLVKVATLKMLSTIWFHLFDNSKKARLWGQRTDPWSLGRRVGVGSDHRGNASGEYSVWVDRVSNYMPPPICQYSQNYIQGKKLSSTVYKLKIKKKLGLATWI